MKTEHQQRIEEFMRLAGQAVPLKPTMPSLEVRRLRANIILEEARETINGLGFEIGIDSHEIPVVSESGEPNIIEVVDGCADISVVTIGTLSAFGVADKPLLETVDAANLRKFGPGSYRRETDGKWMKPPDFKAPDIISVLMSQGYEKLGA